MKQDEYSTGRPDAGATEVIELGPCGPDQMQIRLLHKVGLGQIYSCMLSGPPEYAVLGTHILLQYD